MFAVVDCDSFFASCELVFNPKLQGKPVVVLSSNDGCVVARSKEAKKLGIAMGAPAFQCEALFKKYNVHLFSSNFSLYADMSDRVMSILRSLCYEVEVYSIDEAFISFEGMTHRQIMGFAKTIRQQILQWVGIFVSIGIGPTKTLAKVATEYAKNENKKIVLIEHEKIDAFLENLRVEDIWGIGRRLGVKLRQSQIYTAKQLIERDDAWIKKKLTVVGLRLAWELRGHPTLSFEEIQDPNKSISTARSFDSPIGSLDELECILSGYTADVTQKLREQESMASYITVMIETNRFGQEPYYQNSFSHVLAEPTNYTPTLITHAKSILRSLFRDGLLYKKVGVLLGNFTSMDTYQKDIFEKSSKSLQKQQEVMKLVDRINAQYGKRTIRCASEGARKVRRNSLSSSFTTSWDSLPIAYAKMPRNVKK